MQIVAFVKCPVSFVKCPGSFLWTLIDSFRHEAQLHFATDPKHVGFNSQLMHYVAQALIFKNQCRSAPTKGGA